jgi:Family of unknown function (DUF6244)
VSDIETISNELHAIAGAVDRAQAATASTGGRAQEIAARAAQSGFTGIAAGMSQIRDVVGEIRVRLADVNRTVAEAAALVAAVPKEPSPDRIIAALVPAGEKVSAARQGVAAVVARVDETQRLVAGVLQGGRPGPMLAALAAIKQVLVEVAQRCDAADKQVGTAISAAGQVGGSGE